MVGRPAKLFGPRNCIDFCLGAPVQFQPFGEVSSSFHDCRVFIKKLGKLLHLHITNVRPHAAFRSGKNYRDNPLCYTVVEAPAMATVT